MYIQWTRVLYSVVITGQSNRSISQFNSLCNEVMSVWSMFVYNITGQMSMYYCFGSNNIYLDVLEYFRYAQLT